jgi:signal transduction histidine kinase
VLTGRLTLGRRITLLVVMGLTLVILLFGFLSLRGLQESSDRVFQERLVAAQLTARHIDNFLNLYLDGLTQVVNAEGLDLHDPDPAPKMKILDGLRNSRGGVFAHGIFITDDQGKMLLDNSSVPQPESGSDQDYAISTQILKSGRSAVSNAFKDELGRVLVSLGVPIPGKDGRIEGTLVEVLDLSDPLLNGFVQPVSLGQTGSAEIVDSNGMVLASSNQSRLFQKSDHTDQFAEMIRSGRPTVGGCHSCHETTSGSNVEPALLAFSPLSVAPWGVAIRQSEDEALGPEHNLERSLITAAAVSMLVAVWVVWLASRAVVWPIRALTIASRRIAEGDLDSAVDSTGPAEAGQLARAFDDMRKKLKASLEKLEQANTSLESSVEQRTRQLAALLEVSTVLASTLDLRQLLDAVVARTRDVLELADVGLIALFHEQSGRLEVRASWGYDKTIMKLSLARGEGAAGRAMGEGRPILLNTAEVIQEAADSLTTENWAWLTQAAHGLGTATSVMALPLVVKGHAIGAMEVEHYRDGRTFSATDLRLAQALADHVAVAVENARLYEQVLEKETLRGELLEKVIAAQEEERRRIARELHDDTCQSLAALAMSLEGVEENLPESAGTARAQLDDLKGQVRTTLAEVRTLALNLRPSILDDLGLIMAIDWLCKEQMAKRGLDVELDTKCAGVELPPHVETILFRITQEALNNVLKHSGAAHATVRLTVRHERVVLEVEDDGLGFEPERVLRARGPRYTLGLHGMIERATISGGVLRVISTPGNGTRIRAELPIQAGRENANEKDHSAAGRRS